MDCRFKLAICHFCKKRGHIARACMKVKASGYEHVCYSYGHGIQCKQRKEYVFQVGWMWTVVAVESVLILVMILVMQLMMCLVMQMVKSEV